MKGGDVPWQGKIRDTAIASGKELWMGFEFARLKKDGAESGTVDDGLSDYEAARRACRLRQSLKRQ